MWVVSSGLSAGIESQYWRHSANHAALAGDEEDDEEDEDFGDDEEEEEDDVGGDTDHCEDDLYVIDYDLQLWWGKKQYLFNEKFQSMS